MNDNDVKKLLEVGVLLCAEHDLNRLLEKILSCVMDLTHCDAGTLYLRDGEALRFKIMRNHTMKVYAGGDGRDPDLPPVPLRKENVCALALLEGRTLCVDDVRHCAEYDFSGPLHYDEMTGYHTQSMLVVPMQNREGERLGVLQLINALDAGGHVVPFAPQWALALESVASQAAIAIQNARYISQIKELFGSFVRVMSCAVDERTPYNGSHTRHMAAYGARFVDWLNARAAAAGDPPPFDAAQKQEFLMSVWLHDIGKLVTPLEVMNKVARLLPAQHEAFCHRMELVELYAALENADGRLSAQARQALVADVAAAKALVEDCNTAGFLPDDKLAALNALAARSYTDLQGVQHPWLAADELAMLSIRKGTLSAAERGVMEEHVVITDKLLAQIDFPAEYAHVRAWAASHHELLNGSGYPRHLQGDDIPAAVRILTILDIFDALVADDRPYKPGMPVEKALGILTAMAEKEGKLDPALTGQFIQSRCWEAAG